MRRNIVAEATISLKIYLTKDFENMQRFLEQLRIFGKRKLHCVGASFAKPSAAASIDMLESGGKALPNIRKSPLFFVACSLHLTGPKSNHLLEGAHDNVRKLSPQHPVCHRRVAGVFKAAQGQRFYLSGREWGKSYRRAGT